MYCVLEFSRRGVARRTLPLLLAAAALLGMPRSALADRVVSGQVFFDNDRDGEMSAGDAPAANALVFWETTVHGRTDAQGRYELLVPDASAAGLVWVRSDARMAPGPFWRALPAEPGDISIPVQPRRIDGPFSFIVASDTHAGIKEMPASDQLVGLRAATNIDPTPHFLAVTGDITQANRPEEFQTVLDAIAQIDVPYVPVPGNHDWYDGGAAYRSVFGPPTYAFDTPGAHVVVLNDAASVEERAAFLDLDLPLRADPTRPVIVLMHAPPTGALEEALEQRDIDVVLTGHLHSNRVLRHRGFVEYNTQPLVMGGIDLSPAGFRVVAVAEDGNVSVAHRTLVNAPVVRVVSPGPGESFAPCRARLVVAIEPGEPVASVSAEVEGVAAPIALHPIGGWNYASELLPLCSPGRYSADVTVVAASGNADVLTTSVAIRSGFPSLPHDATRGVRGPPTETVWSRPVGGHVQTVGLAAADGRVFVPVSDYADGARGGVVALSEATGDILWDYRVDASVRGAPAVSGETVVFAATDGTMHAVDASTGEPRWAYELAPDRSPVERSLLAGVAADDGTAIAGGRHEFVCVEASTGALEWSVASKDDYGPFVSLSTPVVADGIAFVAFGRSDGLLALDVQTGALLWSADPGMVRGMHASPVVAEGRLYLLDELSTLRALEATTGTLLWQTRLEMDTFGWGYLAASTPAYRDGRLYVGTQRGRVHAVEVGAGTVLWTTEPTTTSLIRMTHYHGETPTISAGVATTSSHVLAAGGDGWLRGLSPATGEVDWAMDLGVPVLAPPLPASSGLLVASYDGTVRLLRAPAQERAPDGPKAGRDSVPYCGASAGGAHPGGLAVLTILATALLRRRRRPRRR